MLGQVLNLSVIVMLPRPLSSLVSAAVGDCFKT